MPVSVYTVVGGDVWKGGWWAAPREKAADLQVSSDVRWRLFLCTPTSLPLIRESYGQIGPRGIPPPQQARRRLLHSTWGSGEDRELH